MCREGLSKIRCLAGLITPENSHMCVLKVGYMSLVKVHPMLVFVIVGYGSGNMSCLQIHPEI